MSTAAAHKLLGNRTLGGRKSGRLVDEHAAGRCINRPLAITAKVVQEIVRGSFEQVGYAKGGPFGSY